MPSGVGLPHRYPEQPLFGYPKIAKKNWVLVFDRSTTYFLYQNLQNQPAISDHIYGNENFAFLSFLDLFFLGGPLFCPLFRPFLP